MIPTVETVDLQRFAGDWYVLASIPTAFEKEAFNAIESYGVPEGNRIETTFTFNKGGFDGPEKVYRPTAFVSKESTAVWGMQFIWPIKAEYRIVYLEPSYEYTIVGRSKRDYVWIMARSAEVSEARYADLVQRVRELGYDTTALRRVPHASTSDTLGSQPASAPSAPRSVSAG